MYCTSELVSNLKLSYFVMLILMGISLILDSDVKVLKEDRWWLRMGNQNCLLGVCDALVHRVEKAHI